MFRYMMALALIAKAGSLLFFFLSWWFYKPPQNTKVMAAQTPSVHLVQSENKPNSYPRSNGCVNESLNERF